MDISGIAELARPEVTWSSYQITDAVNNVL